MATQRFFDRDRTVDKDHKDHLITRPSKAEFQLVCENNDACFKSLAVAIIDNISAKLLITDEIVSKILEHYRYYFVIPPNYGSLRSRSDVEKLIRTPHETAQFAANLAFILRQRAINEIISKPTVYSEAFSKSANPQTIARMREPAYNLEIETAIAAVSAAYNLPMVVRITSTPGNVIWARKHYNCPSYCQPNLLVLLQDDVIFLQLKEQTGTRFMLVDQTKASPRKAGLNQQQDPEVETLIKEIETERQQSRTVCNEEEKRIDKMLEAKELTVPQLEEALVKNISTTSSRKSVQVYLADVKNAPSHPVTWNVTSKNSYRQMLVEATAIKITRKELDADTLYKQTEARENHQATTTIR